MPPSNQVTFYDKTGKTPWWGGIASAILGRLGGKFSFSHHRYHPINLREFLVDCNPNSLMLVAMSVPHLNTILSRGAELFSLMEIKHVDKDGNEIEDSEITKFLNKPNPLQTIEQYLYQYYILNGVYNKTFQYKLKGLSYQKIPTALWLLPSGAMKVNATGKIYRQSKFEEIISNFELMGGEQREVFESGDVIYMAEGVGTSILNPVSRIESLQIPLSNIIASLKSRNIIITERGMIGFIKNKLQSGPDPQPPNSAEIKRLREEYQNEYHLDSRSGHIGVTSLDAEWVPMTFNVAELGLLEGVEADFACLCDAFGHDRDLYSSVKGATFENKLQGQKNTIQNTMQPAADKLMRVLTAELIDPASGGQLVACYDHLPCMKEDELKEAQAEKTEIEGLSILYRDGIISQEQYALKANVIPDGDGLVKGGQISINTGNNN